FAGHHDVEDQKVEMQTVELGAGIARARGCRDPVTLATEKARQEIADAAVVINQQQMRGVVGGLRRGSRSHGCQGHGHSFAVGVRKIVSSTLSGSSRSIIARRKRRTVSASSGPMVSSARLIRLVCRPASLATRASPLGVA